MVWRLRRRRYRWRRRTRPYRRGYRKIKRHARKMSAYTKAHRFVRRNLRKIKRGPKNTPYTPFQSRQKLMYCQQARTLILPITAFITPVSPAVAGHYVLPIYMADVMDAGQLQILNDYQYMTMLDMSISVKLISVQNAYVYSNIGGALTNYCWNPAAPNKQFFEMYIGKMDSPGMANTCSALNITTGSLKPSNEAAIMESGYYKRLQIVGNMVNFRWKKPGTSKGAYDISDNTSTATIDEVLHVTMNHTTGTGRIETGCGLYAFDICLFNYDRFQNETLDDANRCKFTFQFTYNSVWSVKQRTLGAAN